MVAFDHIGSVDKLAKFGWILKNVASSSQLFRQERTMERILSVPDFFKTLSSTEKAELFWRSGAFAFIPRFQQWYKYFKEIWG
ncbi:hypothetical protein [Paenibacillus uliginis]|uniref:hypothetical protein n=1 Tax=Paenibacillus uliginis TaxID=683737 RepID=UPI001AD846C1